MKKLEISSFKPITPKIGGTGDILSRCLFSLSDYPFQDCVLYSDDSLKVYGENFTVNGEIGIRYPTFNSDGAKTKYVISPDTRPLFEDYVCLFAKYKESDTPVYKFAGRVVGDLNGTLEFAIYTKIKTHTSRALSPLYWFQSKTENSYSNALKTLVTRLSQDKPTKQDVKELYKLRHNVIHMYTCYYFGLPLVLDEDLDLTKYGVSSRLTPDLFAMSDNKVCLIGDVSLTSDPTASRYKKESKYLPLAAHITEKLGKHAICAFYCIDSATFDVRGAFRQGPLSPMRPEDTEFISKLSLAAQLFMDYQDRNKSVFFDAVSEEVQERLDTEPFQGRVRPDIRSTIYESYTVEDLASAIKSDFDVSGPLFNAYKDTVFTEDDIGEAYQMCLDKNKDYRVSTKPTHYIPIPRSTIANGNNYPEQFSIYELMKRTMHESHPFVADLSRAVVESLEGPYSDFNKKMFNTGQPFEEDYEETRREYHRTGRETSYLKWLAKKYPGVPGDEIPHFSKRKIFDMKLSAYSQKGQEFWIQSGQSFDKHHPEKTPQKEPHTVGIDDGYHSVENFMDLLASDYTSSYPEEILEKNISESQQVQGLAELYASEGKTCLDAISGTYGHYYSKNVSYLFEQLIHHSNMSLSDHKIAIFNSGVKNMCVAMICSFRGMSTQLGKPFCVFGYTSNPSEVDPGIFGKLHIEDTGAGDYFFCTRWRRLPLHRMEFFRDQYYSTLASSSSSLMRASDYSRMNIRGTFCLRVLAGYISNQVCMEKLADSKYAIMSSFSEYTNFKDLIEDKFYPPYRNSAEAWIVKRMLNGLQHFRSQLTDPEAVRVFRPTFNEFGMRSQVTAGGIFRIKALWSDRKLYTIQDVLDELFLYVHTPKEPSNIFHEEVNAMRTIEKYQSKYDKMPSAPKSGVHGSVENSIKWLSTSPDMGFASGFLTTAISLLFKRDNPPMEQIQNRCMTETMDEIESTKAVIPENRKALRPTLTDKEIARRHEKITNLFQDASRETVDEFLERRRSEKGSHDYNGRVKVHDALRTHVLSGRSFNVAQAAVDYINEGSPVVADICIKAQYGGKREFYVMSFSAKVMARACENLYKHMSRYSPTECITVPGDKKLMHMQQMMDRTTAHASKNGNKIMYINGDCTKWSAAECMETFWCMNQTIMRLHRSNYVQLAGEVFLKWADKLIQIPPNIAQKVIPMLPGTQYLAKAEDGFRYKSTQNFLQGVFNYSSSFKGDAAQYLTQVLWRKMYPDSSLSSEYLVHSDDYVTSVSYKEEIEIQRYRALQKLCMRACGVGDSVKKTNCQHFFMEFISLVCFNGSMSYPTLKKTKEVALTLPCESFKGDSDAVCSRTAECIRIGTDFASSWMFHRIHMYLLRRAYSLHAGGRNYINYKFTYPVERFGQSDMHPVFYFLCKGDPNNYRVYHYGSSTSLKQLLMIASKGEGLGDYSNQIGAPTFIYNNYNSRILGIRKRTGIEPVDASQYWCDNIAMHFFKPRSPDRFAEWSTNMYFKNSFIKAYNKDSRSTRMLRLSRFSASKCMTFMSGDEMHDFLTSIEGENKYERNLQVESKLLDIAQVCGYIDSQDVFEDTEALKVAIYSGDGTVDTVYKWLGSHQVLVSERTHVSSMCASFTPTKPRWLRMTKNALGHLYYMVDPEGYTQDNRTPIDPDKLQIDKDLFEGTYPGILAKITDKSASPKLRTMYLNMLCNACIINNTGSQVCMTKQRQRSSISEYLVDAFKYNNLYGKVCEVMGSLMSHTMNPYTLEEDYVLGKDSTNSKPRLVVNTAGLLYAASTLRLGMEPSEIRGVRCVVDGDRKTLKDYLNLSYEEAVEEGMNSVELQALAFLNAALYSDFSVMSALASKRLEYGIHYDSREESLEGGVYTGTTKAYYAYSHSQNRVYYNREKGDFRVITSTTNPVLLPGVLYTAQKAVGKISNSAWQMAIQNHYTSIKCSECKAWADGSYYTALGPNILLKKLKKNEKYRGLPVMHGVVDMAPNLVMEKSFLSESALRVNSYTAYYGRTKLFDLPFQRLQGCHMKFEGLQRNSELCQTQSLLFLLGRNSTFMPSSVKHLMKEPDHSAAAAASRAIDYTAVELVIPEDDDLDGAIDLEMIMALEGYDIYQTDYNPREPLDVDSSTVEVLKPETGLGKYISNLSSVDSMLIDRYFGTDQVITMSTRDVVISTMTAELLEESGEEALAGIFRKRIEKSIITDTWCDINGSSWCSKGELKGYKRYRRSRTALLRSKLPEGVLVNKLPYDPEKTYSEIVQIYVPIERQGVEHARDVLREKSVDYAPGINKGEFAHTIDSAWISDLDEPL